MTKLKSKNFNLTIYARELGVHLILAGVEYDNDQTRIYTFLAPTEDDAILLKLMEG